MISALTLLRIDYSVKSVLFFQRLISGKKKKSQVLEKLCK